MNQMTMLFRAAPQRPVSAIFSGNRTAFRRLVSRGALLEMVTAGFYRFWLATDIRRHLWSNTSVDGDAAEYTGRGRELLIGFLIAMAILVPVYLVYFLLGLEAEGVQAFASTPLLGGLYLFGQFAIYRARRYRLTRTVYRGVRFSMAGSGWGYARRAALWSALVWLTLGLALPWRDAALERYKMGHTSYGSLRGSFEGTGGELFKRGWWLWLLSAFPLVALTLTFINALFIPIALVMSIFIYAVFKAVQWRWWLCGVRFGLVELQSNLPRKAFIDLYAKVFGWSVLLMAAFALYLMAGAKVASLLYGVSMVELFKSQALLTAYPMLAYAMVGYLAVIGAMNVVSRIYLTRDLWACVVRSMSIHNIEALSAVAARGELASALGEGFVDGLDVAGF